MAYDTASFVRESYMATRPVVNGPEDCRALFRPHFDEQKGQEVLRALFLTTKNEVIAQELVTMGTVNASLVSPRDIFRRVLAHEDVAAIIVAHNHPSGDPKPSREDVETTRRLVECGRMLGVQVLDHLVFGSEAMVSIRAEGLVKF